MDVTRLTTVAQFDALRPAWNTLAGDVAFRTWEWMAAWWRHYGSAGELYTLCVHDGAALVAIAPWHLSRSRSGARVVQFLGGGEVCSDYLGILCAPHRQREVAEALADWLAPRGGRPSGAAAADRWDLLELTGLDPHDETTLGLAEALADNGHSVRSRPGPNCWRLELPASWEAYETVLSKSHRKQVRRLIDRLLENGRAVLHTVEQPEQLNPGLEILVDLHQRRRAALGEPGCFSSVRFLAFHREVATRMLAAGRLRLHWIEVDGQPAAAEYHLAGGSVIYGYQSGLDPCRLDLEPGRLATIATLRLAMAQGFQAFDFLRGDEPYKAHWRAKPRPLLELRIAGRRTSARLRERAWALAQSVKRWRQPEAL